MVEFQVLFARFAVGFAGDVMRFIIHELPYERPLLAGQLRYERDGQPTGALESWRLTSAVDDFRFLRIDLDARQAPSGRSFLYHATLNPDGQLEQLKYRFWGDGMEISGTVVNQDKTWLAGRTVNGVRYQDEAQGELFLFPSGTGLSLLAREQGDKTGVILDIDTTDPTRVMALSPIEVAIRVGEIQQLAVQDVTIEATAVNIAWEGNRRTVWIDTDNRPLQVWRDDGLTAKAARMVRYA